MEVLPPPPFASELVARLRATSSAMVVAVDAVPAEPILVVPATAWVACVPLTAPPEVLDVELFQHVGMLPKLGRHFHDDVVLLRAEGIVDRRDLRLREGIPQRIVDLNFAQAQTRRGVAVDDQIGLEPARLHVGIHIGELRHILHGLTQLDRPGA